MAYGTTSSTKSSAVRLWIYIMTSTRMLVRIDTKNWRGNYNSHVVRFNTRQHLDNYLRVCYANEITSKVIGFEILDQ